jgi:DNA polymerase-3 subunit delta
VKSYEFAAALTKSGPGPLYLIVGEEDCLREQALAVLRAAVLGQEFSTFNEELLHGDEHSGPDILVRAQEAPVFAARRLLVVKTTEKLSAREGEALLPYLRAPCDSTTLVFVAHKLDGRLKFTQALMKSATVVECGPLIEPRLTAWIKAEAERLGLRLHEEASLLLKEVAGTSLALVQREMEKLAAYVPAGRVAGAADVEALRGREPGASVFDLTAAIGLRDRARVLQILARNLEAGEAPLRILGSLAWQYRQIWKAKDGLRLGGTESEAARTLRMPPFKVRGFLERFSEPHLRSAFETFLTTDSKLKGGSAGAGGLVLESVLLGLCGEPREPAARAAAASRPLSNVRTIRSERP